jgi:hypothetical protein
MKALVKLAISLGILGGVLLSSRASANPRLCSTDCQPWVSCSYHCYDDHGFLTTCLGYGADCTP